MNDRWLTITDVYLVVHCLSKKKTYVRVLLHDYSNQHLDHNRLMLDFEYNFELNFLDDYLPKEQSNPNTHYINFRF